MPCTAALRAVCAAPPSLPSLSRLAHPPAPQGLLYLFLKNEVNMFFAGGRIPVYTIFSAAVGLLVIFRQNAGGRLAAREEAWGSACRAACAWCPLRFSPAARCRCLPRQRRSPHRAPAGYGRYNEGRNKLQAMTAAWLDAATKASSGGGRARRSVLHDG